MYVDMLEHGVFGTEDGTEEIVGTGVDDGFAELIFRGNRIRSTGELLLETGNDIIEERLFLGRGERRAGFPGVDKLHGIVGVATKGLLVFEFAKHDRIGLVVAFVRDISLQFAYSGDVAVVITEDFLPLDESIF